MAGRDFLLPDLGEGLEDAEIVTWRVAEGDRVELNQALVEVNTAKALVEIPAPWEGIVERLHGAEGDVVKVGEPLVTIRVDEEGARPDGGEAATPEDKPKRTAVLVGYGVEDEEPSTPASRAAGAGQGDEGSGPVPASPPVRRLAKELGIDLAALTGTGPRRRVTREDVLMASQAGGPAEAGRRGALDGGASALAAEAGEIEVVAVKGTRRLIAEKMSRSAREIPHVTTFLTIDATHVQAFREDIAAATGQRVSPLPIFVRALVEVCREHPKLNATFNAERLEIALYKRCHVGIATDTERGLIVTVVRDADQRGILDISGEIARLTEAARAGTVKPQEISGGTITVTNVGTFGAEYGTPIINHPEAAILAVGVIGPRALVVDGGVEARPACTLSLSFDHRLLDGAEAGRAMRALADILESPFRLGALPR